MAQPNDPPVQTEADRATLQQTQRTIGASGEVVPLSDEARNRYKARRDEYANNVRMFIPEWRFLDSDYIVTSLSQDPVALRGLADKIVDTRIEQDPSFGEWWRSENTKASERDEIRIRTQADIRSHIQRLSVDGPTLWDTMSDHLIKNTTGRGRTPVRNVTNVVRRNPEAYRPYVGTINPREPQLPVTEEALQTLLNGTSEESVGFRRQVLNDRRREFDEVVSQRHNSGVFDIASDPSGYLKGFHIWNEYGSEALTDYVNLIQYAPGDMEAYRTGELVARPQFTTALQRFRNGTYGRRNPLESAEAMVSGGRAVAPDIRYSDIINRVANELDMDPVLIASVIRKESNFNDRAENSRTQARGLMQLMKPAADDVGVEYGDNMWDPETNIRAGATYLKRQLEAFDGNIDLALAAYNAGPGNVRKYGGIPPFRETQDYVRLINQYRQEYSQTADNFELFQIPEQSAVERKPADWSAVTQPWYNLNPTMNSRERRAKYLQTWAMRLIPEVFDDQFEMEAPEQYETMEEIFAYNEDRYREQRGMMKESALADGRKAGRIGTDPDNDWVGYRRLLWRAGAKIGTEELPIEDVFRTLSANGQYMTGEQALAHLQERGVRTGVIPNMGEVWRIDYERASDPVKFLIDSAMLHGVGSSFMTRVGNEVYFEPSKGERMSTNLAENLPGLAIGERPVMRNGMIVGTERYVKDNLWNGLIGAVVGSTTNFVSEMLSGAANNAAAPLAEAVGARNTAEVIRYVREFNIKPIYSTTPTLGAEGDEFGAYQLGNMVGTLGLYLATMNKVGGGALSTMGRVGTRLARAQHSALARFRTAANTAELSHVLRPSRLNRWSARARANLDDLKLRRPYMFTAKFAAGSAVFETLTDPDASMSLFFDKVVQEQWMGLSQDEMWNTQEYYRSMNSYGRWATDVLAGELFGVAFDGLQGVVKYGFDNSLNRAMGRGGLGIEYDAAAKDYVRQNPSWAPTRANFFPDIQRYIYNTRRSTGEVLMGDVKQSAVRAASHRLGELFDYAENENPTLADYVAYFVKNSDDFMSSFQADMEVTMRGIARRYSNGKISDAQADEIARGEYDVLLQRMARVNNDMADAAMDGGSREFARMLEEYDADNLLKGDVTDEVTSLRMVTNEPGRYRRIRNEDGRYTVVDMASLSGGRWRFDLAHHMREQRNIETLEAVIRRHVNRYIDDETLASEDGVVRVQEIADVLSEYHGRVVGDGYIAGFGDEGWIVRRADGSERNYQFIRRPASELTPENPRQLVEAPMRETRDRFRFGEDMDPNEYPLSKTPREGDMVMWKPLGSDEPVVTGARLHSFDEEGNAIIFWQDPKTGLGRTAIVGSEELVLEGGSSIGGVLDARSVPDLMDELGFRPENADEFEARVADETRRAERLDRIREKLQQGKEITAEERVMITEPPEGSVPRETPFDTEFDEIRRATAANLRRTIQSDPDAAESYMLNMRAMGYSEAWVREILGEYESVLDPMVFNRLSYMNQNYASGRGVVRTDLDWVNQWADRLNQETRRAQTSERAGVSEELPSSEEVIYAGGRVNTPEDELRRAFVANAQRSLEAGDVDTSVERLVVLRSMGYTESMGKQLIDEFWGGRRDGTDAGYNHLVELNKAYNDSGKLTTVTKASIDHARNLRSATMRTEMIRAARERGETALADQLVELQLAESPVAAARQDINASFEDVNARVIDDIPRRVGEDEQEAALRRLELMGALDLKSIGLIQPTRVRTISGAKTKTKTLSRVPIRPIGADVEPDKSGNYMKKAKGVVVQVPDLDGDLPAYAIAKVDKVKDLPTRFVKDSEGAYIPNPFWTWIGLNRTVDSTGFPMRFDRVRLPNSGVTVYRSNPKGRYLLNVQKPKEVGMTFMDTVHAKYHNGLTSVDVLKRNIDAVTTRDTQGRVLYRVVSDSQVVDTNVTRKVKRPRESDVLETEPVPVMKKIARTEMNALTTLSKLSKKGKGKLPAHAWLAVPGLLTAGVGVDEDGELTLAAKIMLAAGMIGVGGVLVRSMTPKFKIRDAYDRAIPRIRDTFDSFDWSKYGDAATQDEQAMLNWFKKQGVPDDDFYMMRKYAVMQWAHLKVNPDKVAQLPSEFLPMSSRVGDILQVKKSKSTSFSSYGISSYYDPDTGVIEPKTRSSYDIHYIDLPVKGGRLLAKTEPLHEFSVHGEGGLEEVRPVAWARTSVEDSFFVIDELQVDNPIQSGKHGVAGDMLTDMYSLVLDGVITSAKNNNIREIYITPGAVQEYRYYSKVTPVEGRGKYVRKVDDFFTESDRQKIKDFLENNESYETALKKAGVDNREVAHKFLNRLPVEEGRIEQVLKEVVEEEYDAFFRSAPFETTIKMLNLSNEVGITKAKADVLSAAWDAVHFELETGLERLSEVSRTVDVDARGMPRPFSVEQGVMPLIRTGQFGRAIDELHRVRTADARSLRDSIIHNINILHNFSTPFYHSRAQLNPRFVDSMDHPMRAVTDLYIHHMVVKSDKYNALSDAEQGMELMGPQEIMDYVHTGILQPKKFEAAGLYHMYDNVLPSLLKKRYGLTVELADLNRAIMSDVDGNFKPNQYHKITVDDWSFLDQAVGKSTKRLVLQGMMGGGLVGGAALADNMDDQGSYEDVQQAGGSWLVMGLLAAGALSMASRRARVMTSSGWRRMEDWATKRADVRAYDRTVTINGQRINLRDLDMEGYFFDPRDDSSVRRAIRQRDTIRTAVRAGSSVAQAVATSRVTQSGMMFLKELSATVRRAGVGTDGEPNIIDRFLRFVNDAPRSASSMESRVGVEFNTKHGAGAFHQYRSQHGLALVRSSLNDAEMEDGVAKSFFDAAVYRFLNRGIVRKPDGTAVLSVNVPVNLRSMYEGQAGEINRQLDNQLLRNSQFVDYVMSFRDSGYNPVAEEYMSILLRNQAGVRNRLAMTPMGENDYIVRTARTERVYTHQDVMRLVDGWIGYDASRVAISRGETPLSWSAYIKTLTTSERHLLRNLKLSDNEHFERLYAIQRDRLRWTDVGNTYFPQMVDQTAMMRQRDAFKRQAPDGVDAEEYADEQMEMQWMNLNSTRYPQRGLLRLDTETGELALKEFRTPEEANAELTRIIEALPEEARDQVVRQLGERTPNRMRDAGLINEIEYGGRVTYYLDNPQGAGEIRFMLDGVERNLYDLHRQLALRDMYRLTMGDATIRRSRFLENPRQYLIPHEWAVKDPEGAWQAYSRDAGYRLHAMRYGIYSDTDYVSVIERNMRSVLDQAGIRGDAQEKAILRANELYTEQYGIVRDLEALPPGQRDAALQRRRTVAKSLAMLRNFLAIPISYGWSFLNTFQVGVSTLPMTSWKSTKNALGFGTDSWDYAAIQNMENMLNEYMVVSQTNKAFRADVHAVDPLAGPSKGRFGSMLDVAEDKSRRLADAGFDFSIATKIFRMNPNALGSRAFRMTVDSFQGTNMLNNAINAAAFVGEFNTLSRIAKQLRESGEQVITDPQTKRTFTETELKRNLVNLGVNTDDTLLITGADGATRRITVYDYMVENAGEIERSIMKLKQGEDLRLSDIDSHTADIIENILHTATETFNGTNRLLRPDAWNTAIGKTFSMYYSFGFNLAMQTMSNRFLRPLDNWMKTYDTDGKFGRLTMFKIAKIARSGDFRQLNDYVGAANAKEAMEAFPFEAVDTAWRMMAGLGISTIGFMYLDVLRDLYAWPIQAATGEETFVNTKALMSGVINPGAPEESQVKLSDLFDNEDNAGDALKLLTYMAGITSRSGYMGIYASPVESTALYGFRGTTSFLPVVGITDRIIGDGVRLGSTALKGDWEDVPARSLRFLSHFSPVIGSNVMRDNRRAINDALERKGAQWFGDGGDEWSSEDGWATD